VRARAGSGKTRLIIDLAAKRARKGERALAVTLNVNAKDELRDRGVHIAREARREPWGLHEMHVSDPDGVTLIFVQVPDDHPLRRDTRG